MPDYSKIVPNALNGDAKALEELYSATFRAVYFTCLSFTKNEQDAEDLTQNTYITAFKKLNTLTQYEKFEPWIKRVAANLCKDFLAKKAAHTPLALDEENLPQLADEGILPEEYITVSEKRSIVMKIMRESLSDVLYQTVIMFYFDEMSIAEIAEEMRCPEGTVKYRLNAARAKIKKGVLDYEKRTDDRLYAFVGMPFLARLLIEESKSVSVPTFAVPAASDIPTSNSSFIPENAASAANTAVNSAADSAAKGGLKLFLSTLKGKIIAAAAAAAVVGGGVTAAFVIANNAADHSSDSGYLPSNSSSVTQSNSKPNNGSSSGLDYSRSKFWIARQNWTEAPRTEFEGGLLRDNRKKVDLTNLDVICAPYKAYKMVEPNADGEYVTDKLADCFNSELLIEPGGRNYIETQYRRKDEPYPDFDGLENIHIFNLDDEPRSVGYCLKQNWWKNNYTTVYPDETVSLGLDPELKKTGIAPEEDDMLDAIKEKFGTPHYLRCSTLGDESITDFQAMLDKQVDHEFGLERGEDYFIIAMSYDMIYDYGDFVMEISVREQVFSKENHMTDVECVEFWSRELWDRRTEIDSYYGGERDGDVTYSPLGVPETPSKPDDSSSSDSNPTSDVNSTPSEYSDLPFWLPNKVWNEPPRSDFEGGLLIDNRKTVDPREIDDISAPYRSYKGGAETFMDAVRAADDIESIGYLEIQTQDVPFMSESLPFDGIGSVYILNFDNIAHSAEDCLENNWWVTYPTDQSYRYICTAIGLDSSLKDTSLPPHDFKLLDAILEKFGTPNYIRYSADYDPATEEERRNAIYNDMAKVYDPGYNGVSANVTYELVYELSDKLVMTVSVTEAKWPDSDITLVVDYATFWGYECWENRRAFDDPAGLREILLYSPYKD